MALKDRFVLSESSEVMFEEKATAVERDSDRRDLVRAELLLLQSRGFPAPEDFFVDRATISQISAGISGATIGLNYKTSFETVAIEDTKLYEALFELYEQVVAVHEVLSKF